VVVGQSENPSQITLLWLAYFDGPDYLVDTLSLRTLALNVLEDLISDFGNVNAISLHAHWSPCLVHLLVVWNTFRCTLHQLNITLSHLVYRSLMLKRPQLFLCVMSSRVVYQSNDCRYFGFLSQFHVLIGTVRVIPRLVTLTLLRHGSSLD